MLTTDIWTLQKSRARRARAGQTFPQQPVGVEARPQGHTTRHPLAQECRVGIQWWGQATSLDGLCRSGPVAGSSPTLWPGEGLTLSGPWTSLAQIEARSRR